MNNVWEDHILLAFVNEVAKKIFGLNERTSNCYLCRLSETVSMVKYKRLWWIVHVVWIVATAKAYTGF
jgi:hypothetical protein